MITETSLKLKKNIFSKIKNLYLGDKEIERREKFIE